MPIRQLALAALLMCAAVFSTQARAAEKGPSGPGSPGAQLPFKPGEKLTYEISWSNILEAGKAVMEVKREESPSGETEYHLISTARSVGILNKFYRVNDVVESRVDDDCFHSIAFHLDQHHGKRELKRDMTFDHDKGTVTVDSDGKKQVFSVPDNVQDALSALYYVRTRQDFNPGKPIVVNVHDDDKTWAVEVQTLGRERIKTPLGEFNTIKIKTFPRYEGVFQNKGEIYIWLTDDDRKIPVLMKSTIAIGTIVSTLVELQPGEEKYEAKNTRESTR